MTEFGKRMVKAARSFAGTPFVHQARQPGAGLDCVGLIVCAAGLAGKTLTAPINYDRDPFPELLSRGIRSNGLRRISRLASRQDGDMLAFWVKRRGNPTHCAVSDGQGMVHVVKDECVRLYRDIPEFWRVRLHSVWRIS